MKAEFSPTEQYNTDSKKKHRTIILLIIFLIALGITISIAIASHFASNVYKNNEEFREYADTHSEYEQIFKVTDQTRQEYNYGEPISYVVNYDIVKDEKIAAFRDEKIKEMEAEFKKEKAAEEKSRAKVMQDKNDYKPLTRAMIINSAVYHYPNGTVSIAIYSSDNREKKKDMVKTSSRIETYLLSEETGRSLLPVQTLREGYKSICCQYLTDYFGKTYSDEERTDNWEEYLTADENNFNKFVMKEKDVIFYFDEGTVLKKSKGIVSARIPNMILADSIRAQIINRYIDPGKPMVALTYDDGPGGESETRILDCLEKNGAVATFFYYGSKIANDPGKVKRALDIGCEIGNHTWSHPVLTDISKEQVAAEISQTNEAIKAACGSYPTVFRPSYGMSNDSINAIVNMPIIMWSLDTLDWKTRDAAKTFEAISKSPSLDGKIILMHSIHDPTAAATELIVPWLTENGYQTVTVSELIKYKQGTTPENGRVYK